MRLTSLSRLVLLFLLALTTVPAFSADEPKKEPKPAAAPSSTSEPRLQTFKGFTYFAIKTRTNLQKIGETVSANVAPLKKAIEASHAQITGPMTFIYHGVTGDPTTEFDMEIGYPIAEKVADAGDFKVRQAGEYSCVSLLYTGPVAGVGGAYEKLFTSIAAQSLKPTGELREMMLYFEGPESPNNVTHISVGVK